MKLKYFFPMFVATVAMLASCADDEVVSYPDGLRVSSSYIALPVDGGSASIDVFTNQKWDVDTVGAFKKKQPWFDYSVTSVDNGQKLTLTADATLDGRNTTFKLVAADGTKQYINVIQGLSTISTATCAEVIAGPDSKTYQVKGTCTGIANTTYGNWYLNDGTGEIYIYGTLDKNGKEKNFLSLGLEVGDEVIVQGPKTTYGSTIELVNVTVVAINKSLIKVDSTYVAGEKGNTLPLEGGELTAYVSCKGKGVSVDIPEDAKE
ncbi:MAG: DNA-binding protein, partial [Prevotellaceae bacterium]|nr:DNA-binding protein [Prevotellaceae bacterium]